jgi:hypothetical protein
MKGDWDMRPVYRWCARLNTWRRVARGRYVKPCPINFAQALTSSPNLQPLVKMR